MNFPHSSYARPAVHNRTDHKALLAAAIARQANGRTVRAMIMSARNRRHDLAGASDVMGQRIHYFSSHNSGHSSQGAAEEQPFGSFFPQNSGDAGGNIKSEDDVYQSGSVNLKEQPIEMAVADLQQKHAGQELSRTL